MRWERNFHSNFSKGSKWWSRQDDGASRALPLTTEIASKKLPLWNWPPDHLHIGKGRGHNPSNMALEEKGRGVERDERERCDGRRGSSRQGSDGESGGGEGGGMHRGLHHLWRREGGMCRKTLFIICSPTLLCWKGIRQKVCVEKKGELREGRIIWADCV